MPRLHRFALPLAAVIASAAAIAGCGGSRSADSEIRHVFASYQKAVDARDGPAACGLATGELRTQMATMAQHASLGDSCADLFKFDAKQRRDAQGGHVSISIAKVTVKRGHATAELILRFKPTEGGASSTARRLSASFVRSGSRWLIGETTASGIPRTPFKQGSRLASQIARVFASSGSPPP